MAAYDQNNVFAKILRGELPCHKVYEDEHTLALMDIMPRAEGHVLVIPKTPARNILDVSEETLARTMASVQKVARAVQKAMGADGLTIQQFNESAGGQVVFHLHVHILPRWEGVSLRPHTGEMAPNDKLAALAERIRAALG
ncbi:MAG TPA: HIT family protein [Beijerinckiaceae bacterium]|nr:HIT family protein [Beijerinckiaceae bacterium]